jgi:hypothetical protein
MATADDQYVRGLIAMQRRFAHSNNRFEQCFGSLLVAGTLDRHLATLSDKQIGQLMSDHVGRDLSIFQPELTICQHAIRRLFRSAGGRLTAEDFSQCELPALKTGMSGIATGEKK